MNNIPKKLREQMAMDPFYSECARAAALEDHVCVRDPMRPGKPVEWEHALVYANRQVQARFAIVPICWWAHRGPGLNKEINVWIAINRATDEELVSLSHKGGRDYFQYRHYLNRKYGVYKLVDNGANSMRIGCGYYGENEEVIHNAY